MGGQPPSPCDPPHSRGTHLLALVDGRQWCDLAVLVRPEDLAEGAGGRLTAQAVDVDPLVLVLLAHEVLLGLGVQGPVGGPGTAAHWWVWPPRDTPVPRDTPDPRDTTYPRDTAAPRDTPGPSNTRGPPGTPLTPGKPPAPRGPLPPRSRWAPAPSSALAAPHAPWDPCHPRGSLPRGVPGAPCCPRCPVLSPHLADSCL